MDKDFFYNDIVLSLYLHGLIGPGQDGSGLSNAPGAVNRICRIRRNPEDDFSPLAAEGNAGSIAETYGIATQYGDEIKF